MKKLLCLMLTVCSFVLVGCSKDVQPGEYDSSEVGKIKKVVPGVLISKRPVKIRSKSSEGVQQATAGSVPEENNNSVSRSRGFEYVVRLNSGSIISVVQTEELSLKAKQHILVIYGDNTRVVADDGSEEY
jgi:outer membrane lipoprotein SlyB